MGDEVESAPEEITRGGRRPILAFLLGLLLPPLGHVYAGSARRGFVIWLVSLFLAASTVLWFVAYPTILVLAVGILLGILMAAVLAFDAWALARARGPDYQLRPYNRVYVYVLLGLLLWSAAEARTAVAKSWIRAFRTPSMSMRPTLVLGDFFFVRKTPVDRSPRRGRIVTIPYPRDPSKTFVKRVVGLPGEVIEIRNKEVFINGVPLNEPYVIHEDPTTRPAGYDYRDNFGPYSIPSDAVFVMGDNRDNSNDSRFFGPIPSRAIIGTAVVIYWSWDPGGNRVRWERIGRNPETLDPVRYERRSRGPRR